MGVSSTECQNAAGFLDHRPPPPAAGFQSPGPVIDASTKHSAIVMLGCGVMTPKQLLPGLVQSDSNPAMPALRFGTDANGISSKQQGVCRSEEAGGRFLGKVGHSVRPGVESRRAQVTSAAT